FQSILVDTAPLSLTVPEYMIDEYDIESNLDLHLVLHYLSNLQWTQYHIHQSCTQALSMIVVQCLLSLLHHRLQHHLHTHQGIPRELQEAMLFQKEYLHHPLHLSTLVHLQLDQSSHYILLLQELSPKQVNGMYNQLKQRMEL